MLLDAEIKQHFVESIFDINIMIVYVHSISKIDSQGPFRPPRCNFITTSDFILVPTDLKLIAETLERVSQCDVIFTKFTSLDFS